VNDSYWDTVLVCSDGNLIHNKLTVGLLFPHLLEASAFSFPVQTTLLLPDFTVREISQTLKDLIGASAGDKLQDMRSLPTTSAPPSIPQQFQQKDMDLMLMERGVKTFKCGFCDQSFSHLDELVRHKKVHTNKISVDDFPDFDDAAHDDDDEPAEAVVNDAIAGSGCDEEELEKKHVELQERVMNLEPPVLQDWIKPKEMKPKEKPSSRQKAASFPEEISTFNGNLMLEADDDNYYMNENDSPDDPEEFEEDGRVNVHEFVEEQMKAFKEEKLATKGSRSARRTYTGEIHPGDKPYKCTFCDKRFKQVGHVNLHERTHTGGQKYICQYCNKKFNQSSHLKDHLRIHTGEKPFMCSDCGKCFGYNSALKSHRRIHTGEKCYKCKFCEKTFNQLGNLKTHERLHTGELKYMCSECGKCYNTRSNLSRHACKSNGKMQVQQIEVHNMML